MVAWLSRSFSRFSSSSFVWARWFSLSARFSADLWSAGYAGTLSWSYGDGTAPWSPGAVSGFANQHVCETAY